MRGVRLSSVHAAGRRRAWASRGWSQSCSPTSVDDAIVLSGRCLHYGEGITFWPLIEALSTVGDRARDVLERLGSGGVAIPEELFFEVRRLLESLALERPVILHVDDLQWAEAMLLDLLDHVVELSRGAPILLLCSARPELLEDRPTWGGGKLNATAVLLEPLAAADCSAATGSARRWSCARRAGAGDRRERRQSRCSSRRWQRSPASAAHSRYRRRSRRCSRQGSSVSRVEERELLERGAIEGEVFHRLPLRALATSRHADLERRDRGPGAQGADPPASVDVPRR